MLVSIRVNKAAVHRNMRITSSDFPAPFYFNILRKELAPMRASIHSTQVFCGLLSASDLGSAWSTPLSDD